VNARGESGGARERPGIVNRSFVLAGAFALAAAQPIVTIAAPAPAPAHVHTAAAAPHAAPHNNDATSLGDFKAAPSRFDGQMKPLTMPQHFTVGNSAKFAPLPVSPYQRYGWQAMPSSLWYPTLMSPACAASNFAASTSGQPASGFTLGSLADGKSNLLSSKNYGNSLAPSGDHGAASASPGGLTIGFAQAGCGAPSFATP
jgi:hypothetical protein